MKRAEDLGLDITADGGQLAAGVGGQNLFRFAFYRKDFVLALNPDGSPTHSRANFVRGTNGQVEWLRCGGRLFRFHPTGTRRATTFSHRLLWPAGQ